MYNSQFKYHNMNAFLCSEKPCPWRQGLSHNTYIENNIVGVKNIYRIIIS